MTTETKTNKRDHIGFKQDAILCCALDRRNRELSEDIKRETNKKEKARLEDEQASIRLVLRLFPSVKVYRALDPQ
jgi:hypothetical protein